MSHLRRAMLLLLRGPLADATREGSLTWDLVALLPPPAAVGGGCIELLSR